MDYMFPSINLENNNSLSQEEEPLLFSHFPILPNFHNNHKQISTDVCTTNMTTTTRDHWVNSKLKCVRKKRSAGKKDRHSKIHTAQGLRDRRMRLSVPTARKFFDLNDMLGFDKASKTIEWLFLKSQEAIDEVTETLQGVQAEDATQIGSKENNVIESLLSACKNESVMEINKDENLEIQGDHIEDENSRKSIQSYPLVSNSKRKVKAKETERTRDMMMMDHLEKPKQLFQGQSQLGFSVINPDNHNMDISSSDPLEYSDTYHFLKQLHLDNNLRNPDTYLGNITANSSTKCSVYDHNKTIAEPPLGWLNSRNTFLGFLGGWDSENSIMESNNGIAPNIPTLSGFIRATNFENFLSQNEGQ